MIQTTIPKHHVNKFKTRLEEEEAYIYENFKVSKSQGNYRPVSNSKKILFLCFIQITRVECSPTKIQ